MADIDSSSPEAIKAYYQHLFPFKQLAAWLAQSNTPTTMLTHREFAFTLPGDVYLRYQSFSNHDDFRNHVLNLNPSRFEIGPVYSARPKDKKSLRPGRFHPLQRELIFDIDLTDYDPIRICCSKAEICAKCWGFMTTAVKVLHEALTDQFGFRHLLWVYSGRRGVHCWVSDREACEMNDDARKAVVGWLAVQDSIKGGRISVRGAKGLLTPSVQQCLPELGPAFTYLILQQQDLFSDESKWTELLAYIPYPSIANALREGWLNDPGRSSERKWKDVWKRRKDFPDDSLEQAKYMAALEDIVITYTYPRLDSAVSKHLNHLLKSPFCVHPKTGRICVPFDPENAEDFDPEQVPTVAQLLAEVDKVSKTGMAVDGEQIWERTTLGPYIKMLEQHSAAIMESNRRLKQEKLDTSW